MGTPATTQQGQLVINTLDITHSQTYTYGTKSVMHSCIKYWNNFKRSFPKLFQRIKSVLTNLLLNQY